MLGFFDVYNEEKGKMEQLAGNILNVSPILSSLVQWSAVVYNVGYILNGLRDGKACISANT